jgi:hypothetical protein
MNPRQVAVILYQEFLLSFPQLCYLLSPEIRAVLHYEELSSAGNTKTPQGLILGCWRINLDAGRDGA